VDDQRSSFTAPAEEGRISHSSLGDLHGESGQRAIDTGETRANQRPHAKTAGEEKTHHIVADQARGAGHGDERSSFQRLSRSMVNGLH
jgi:hypothetical protein